MKSGFIWGSEVSAPFDVSLLTDRLVAFATAVSEDKESFTIISVDLRCGDEVLNGVQSPELSETF